MKVKACKSSIGRRYIERIDTLIEEPFFNDIYYKIMKSKAFRRLAFKTQAIPSPENPHVRSRLIHTVEVIGISVGIARKLGLNEDLCIAIAAGHDMGHAPYGHVGERLLTELGGKPFRHNVNSVVIAQHIERKGKGLNLSYETLEGMLNHTRGSGKLYVNKEHHQEYSVVMFADKIAYLFADLNDAVRYGHLDKKMIPDCVLKLGRNQREREKKTINALLSESRKNGFVQLSEGKVFERFEELKDFMYEEVYNKMDVSLQKEIICRMYEFFSKESLGVDPVVLISLLTDMEANRFGEILLYSRKPSVNDLKNFGIFEIIPHIRNKEIDYIEPDLDWKPVKHRDNYKKH